MKAYRVTVRPNAAYPVTTDLISARTVKRRKRVVAARQQRDWLVYYDIFRGKVDRRTKIVFIHELYSSMFKSPNSNLQGDERTHLSF